MTQGLLPHLTLDDFFQSVKARKEAAYAARGNFMHEKMMGFLSGIKGHRTSKLKSPKPRPNGLLELIREWIPTETEYLDIYKVKISKGSRS